MAKDAADGRLFITVFVTSEGLSPSQILGKLCFGFTVVSSPRSRMLITDLRSPCQIQTWDVLALENLGYSEITGLLYNKHERSVQYMSDIYALVRDCIKLIKTITRKPDKGAYGTSIPSLLHQNSIHWTLANLSS